MKSEIKENTLKNRLVSLLLRAERQELDREVSVDSAPASLPDLPGPLRVEADL